MIYTVVQYFLIFCNWFLWCGGVGVVIPALMPPQSRQNTPPPRQIRPGGTWPPASRTGPEEVGVGGEKGGEGRGEGKEEERRELRAGDE